MNGDFIQCDELFINYEEQNETEILLRKKYSLFFHVEMNPGLQIK
jgi:hypothetical protein